MLTYQVTTFFLFLAIRESEGEAVPLQAWSGPEGSRKLRLPDFMKTALEVCQPYAPAAFTPRKSSQYSFVLEAKSTPEPQCDRQDYINEKIQFHHLGSNQRPSDLQHSTLTTVPPRSPAYCHLRPVRFYCMFPHYLINGTIFEIKLWNTKYFSIFSTNFV